MEKAIIIPREFSKEKELILIPRRIYESLLENQKVSEKDVLQWTKEARDFKKKGMLPQLKLN